MFMYIYKLFCLTVPLNYKASFKTIVVKCCVLVISFALWPITHNQILCNVL